MLEQPSVQTNRQPDAAAITSVRFPDPKARESFRRRLLWFGLFALLLLLAFSNPLGRLVRFASHSDLYSHIFLIPCITLYLIWVDRRSLAPDARLNWPAATVPFFMVALLLTAYGLAVRRGWQPPLVDFLAIMTAAFLALLLAGALVVMGSGFLRRYTFPVMFLVFAIPFPTFVRDAIDVFFQHGSATVAYSMLWASGMPILRDGLVFHLSSFSIEVAPQCSGIHSSLVLFITSLLAGHLFLHRKSSRVLLTSAVIPLALVRNGFRIFTIAQLCVQVKPKMIDSFIHKQGGPVFFAFSLLPFFLLLVFLRKRELRAQPGGQTGIKSAI